MSSRFRDTTHQRMREAALDVAADDVIRQGWNSLRMRSIAERVGVSRQTLYNTFAGRHGLAEALTARLTDEFLDGVEAALADHTGLYDQLAAAARHALDRAVGDALFQAFLHADRSTEFLDLLTSDGAPVITAARERITTVVLATHPELDRHRVADAAETTTRLAVSHMVCPLHPTDQIAEHIAEIGTRYLEPSTTELVAR